MTKMRRQCHWLGIWTSVWSFACAPPSLNRIEDGHLTYEYSDGLAPCGGTPAYLRRSAMFVAEHLGAPSPRPARFSWLSTEDRNQLPGRPTDHADVAVGAHAKSYKPYEQHELVHVSITKASAPFFVEGLAVAFGPLANEASSLHPLGVPEDPRPKIAAWPVAAADYSTAGRFVQYLLALHGPEAFMAFYVALGPPWNKASIEARFESEFGTSLDEEVALFMDRGGYPENCVFDVQPMDCGAPPLAPEGNVWGLSRVLSCESDDVVGGEGADLLWRNFIVRTVDIDQEGDYRLSAFGDSGGGVRLAACFGCPWGRQETFTEASTESTTHLLEGRYYVRMSAYPGEALDVGFVLQRTT